MPLSSSTALLAESRPVLWLGGGAGPNRAAHAMAGAGFETAWVASCCDALQLLQSSRYATEGLKRDLRDEVEFRQARLSAQGR